MAGKNTLTRHKTNPFAKELVINKSSKQVRVSTMGGDNNVLVNQNTGEVQGTHVVTYKQVDDAEFIKLFTGNIALAFDLSAAGNKAFCVMLFSQQRSIQKDTVYLDELVLEEFLESNSHVKRCSMQTLYRGISELEKAQILAKSIRPGLYFVNPSFSFNGDRVAFTTAIERKRSASKKENQLEMDM